MPSVGQNGFRRLVRRTSRCATVNVTLSRSVGSVIAVGLATSAFLGATKNALDRRELRWTLTVARGAGDRRVLELNVGEYASQHQTATTHVAATDKRRWKHELVAEDRLQHFDVLA